MATGQLVVVGSLYCVLTDSSRRVLKATPVRLDCMVCNEFLESKLDGLANAPTAADLEYEDSELCTTLSTQGFVEFRPDESAESPETWLRTDTESFVFTLEECR